MLHLELFCGVFYLYDAILYYWDTLVDVYQSDTQHFDVLLICSAGFI